MPGRSLFRRGRTAALASAFALTAAAVALWSGVGGSSAQAAAGVPTPDHTVVVVFENHAYNQVIGSSSAPYINSLKTNGASLSASYALTHPSQPNYFALFSGATQGITDDSCYTPGFSSQPNLASELIAAGEDLGQLQRGPAEPGFDHLLVRRLRPQAQPVVRVQQRPHLHGEDVRAVPLGLLDAPPGLLRGPRPVQRHARLLGVDR